MASTSSFLVPRGFRLNPKDDELVMLLRNEIAGKHSSIPHIDLYSKLPPWEIFPSSSNNPNKQKQKQEGWWCFTTLKKVSQSGCGSRFDRSAGDGCTWHDSSRPTRIRDDNNNNTVVAYKKTYKFLLPNGDRKTHWYMHECTLLAHPSLALCRVFLRPPTTAPSKLKTLPPPRPLPPPPHLRMTVYPYSPFVEEHTAYPHSTPDVHAFVEEQHAALNAYPPSPLDVHALVGEQHTTFSPITTCTMPQHSSPDDDSCDEFAHFLEGQLQDDVQALVGEHAALSPSTTSTIPHHSSTDEDSCDEFAHFLEGQLLSQALVGEQHTACPSTTSTMSQHDDDSCDGFAQLLERQLQDDAFPDLMVANDRYPSCCQPNILPADALPELEAEH